MKRVIITFAFIVLVFFAFSRCGSKSGDKDNDTATGTATSTATVTGSSTGTSSSTGTGASTLTGGIYPEITGDTLIIEIDCSLDNSVEFWQSPDNASQVQTILDRDCRVIPNDGGVEDFFGYKIGKGLGLQAGKCYLLEIDYPEDQSRSFHVSNYGCETIKGLACGRAVGDALNGKYVNNNSESLDFPVSNSFKTWKQVFWLHDRFSDIKLPRGRGSRPFLPADGFWVIFSQFRYVNCPLSAGIAVSKIRLYEIDDPSSLYITINEPPDGLPKRHIFWREEMADAVIDLMPGSTEEVRGIADRADWYEYKMKLARVMGIDTFCKDLLEFGHNQGWDTKSGSEWYNESADPGLWSEILARLSNYDLYVMPYYEYMGSFGQNDSIGIGGQNRCLRLDGTSSNYTHISWCWNADCDVVDPDFITDAERLLDRTIVDFKDNANFIGAWFRMRPELMPVSFNDLDLGYFATEANGGTAVTRTDLQGNASLLDEYYDWWFERRKQYLEALADHLRTKVDSDMFVLYTSDNSEPGLSLDRYKVGEGYPEPWNFKRTVVTDNVSGWQALLAGSAFTSSTEPAFDMFRPVSFDNVVSKEIYLESILEFQETWGGYEWHHSAPPPDPENYVNSEKAMMSYSFSRQYMVSSDNAFEAFRTGRGLALTRHYSLNENEMGGDENDCLLGYFVSDVDRTGPHIMHAEARAMANGDPRYLSYLLGSGYSRGFPEYVRNFNAAFLSLPALESELVPGASTDPDVVVRKITTASHGTYLIVVNVAFTSKTGVTITMPVSGTLTDAPTGAAVSTSGNTFSMDMYPCQLRAFRIQ